MSDTDERVAQAFAAGQRCAYDDCIETAEIFERLLDEGGGNYASLAVAADGGLAEQLRAAKERALLYTDLARLPETTP